MCMYIYTCVYVCIHVHVSGLSKEASRKHQIPRSYSYRWCEIPVVVLGPELVSLTRVSKALYHEPSLKKLNS